MKSIGMQDAYPSQAEGGLAGDISASLKRALKAWDQRRFDAERPYKYGTGRSQYVRKKPTTREEATWNPKQ